jgi:hypothetical protein
MLVVVRIRYLEYPRPKPIALLRSGMFTKSHQFVPFADCTAPCNTEKEFESILPSKLATMIQGLHAEH